MKAFVLITLFVISGHFCFGIQDDGGEFVQPDEAQRQIAQWEHKKKKLRSV